MVTKFQLPEEYVQIGFNISRLGEQSFVLKHHHRPIFVFGSDLDLKDDFIDRLCDSYIRLASNAVEMGLSL